MTFPAPLRLRPNQCDVPNRLAAVVEQKLILDWHNAVPLPTHTFNRLATNLTVPHRVFDRWALETFCIDGFCTRRRTKNSEHAAHLSAGTLDDASVHSP